MTSPVMTTSVPASDARGLRQTTGDPGRAVEHAEAADRDVDEAGVRGHAGEQVGLEVVVDGLLRLERVDAAEDALGPIGEPDLRDESRDCREGRRDLVTGPCELFLWHSVEI